MAKHRRTIVLGDLHLTRRSEPAVARDFAALLDEVGGARVIVAGDFFDFTMDAATCDRSEATRSVLAAHPPLRGAIGRFVDSGGELVLLGGNHDADLGSCELRSALLDAVEPTVAGRARISGSPWFLRERSLHVEHGHFYDPDNAPAHPLVVGARSLGVHFSAEFLNPTGAHRYLQANDDTPLKLFLSAFRWYGPRGPYVVYRYFRTALDALARSGPFYRARGERRIGQEHQARFAIETGVAPSLVDDLIALGAPPTLESWYETFARLYLDRALPTVLCSAGVAAVAAGWRRAGGGCLALGASLLTISWLNGHDRYRGRVVDQLGAAAERIADSTDAQLVIFGHTHREALGKRYANTGSFAFPRHASGRPLLEVEWGAGRPRALRRYVSADCDC